MGPMRPAIAGDATSAAAIRWRRERELCRLAVAKVRWRRRLASLGVPRAISAK
jgi:hypothetical protein